MNVLRLDIMIHKYDEHLNQFRIDWLNNYCKRNKIRVVLNIKDLSSPNEYSAFLYEYQIFKFEMYCKSENQLKWLERKSKGWFG